VTDKNHEAVSDAKKYLGFYVKHRKLFEDAQSAATVAILYPHKAIIYDFDHHWAALRGMEQTCLQHGIPFELVFPEHLSERINDFEVLLVPDYPCLEDENISIIRDWVAGGGGLYASGRTSLTDEHFQERLDYALADLFGTSLQKERTMPSGLRIRHFGEGRVAFSSSNPEKGTFLDGAGKPFGNLAEVSFQQKVKMRLNEGHAHLARIIGELAPGGPPIEVIAPLSVAADAYYKDKTLMVHLVNYEPEVEKENIPVIVHRRLFKAKSARVLSPDYNARRLKIATKRGRAEATLERLVVYSLIEFK
jgi:hypothetical protein